MTTTNPKRKTVMCEFVHRSHGCRHGANCTHAHNIFELKGSESDWWRRSWVSVEGHRGYTEWETRSAWVSQDKSEEARTVRWAASPAKPVPLKSNRSVFRGGRNRRRANPIQCPMLQADFPVMMPPPPGPYDIETAYINAVCFMGQYLMIKQQGHWAAETRETRWDAWGEAHPDTENHIGYEIDDEIDVSLPAYIASVEPTGYPETMKPAHLVDQGRVPQAEDEEADVQVPVREVRKLDDAVELSPSDEPIGPTSPDQDDNVPTENLDATEQPSLNVQQLESHESIGSARTSCGQADEELPETMRKSFSARFVSLLHTCQRRRCH